MKTYAFAHSIIRIVAIFILATSTADFAQIFYKITQSDISYVRDSLGSSFIGYAANASVMILAIFLTKPLARFIAGETDDSLPMQWNYGLLRTGLRLLGIYLLSTSILGFVLLQTFPIPEVGNEFAKLLQYGQPTIAKALAGSLLCLFANGITNIFKRTDERSRILELLEDQPINEEDIH